MVRKDYYKILGVSKDASADEIKKAYRRKSKELHPDRNKGDKQKEEQFKELAEAFSVLGDSSKRAQYDNGGFNEFEGGGFNMDINDIIRDFMGGFNNDIFNGGGFNNRRQNKGQDVLVKVALTLEEMYTGVKKKIKIHKKSLCPTCKGEVKTCNECGGTGVKTHTQRSAFGITQTQTICNRCGGTGKIASNTTCKTCNSTGFIDTEEVIEIDFKKGLFHGAQLIMKGNGNPVYDGINGDLIIQVLQYQNDRFERKGNDLYMNISNIPIIDVLLGLDYEFNTIDGAKLSIKIPKTINNGLLKLSKKGMPIYNNSDTTDYGDLYLNISYKLPDKLNDNEIKLLKKLKLSENFK
jgi:molecular chaperone DnaJ